LTYKKGAEIYFLGSPNERKLNSRGRWGLKKSGALSRGVRNSGYRQSRKKNQGGPVVGHRWAQAAAEAKKGGTSQGGVGRSCRGKERRLVEVQRLVRGMAIRTYIQGKETKRCASTIEVQKENHVLLKKSRRAKETKPVAPGGKGRERIGSRTSWQGKKLGSDFFAKRRSNRKRGTDPSKGKEIEEGKENFGFGERPRKQGLRKEREPCKPEKKPEPEREGNREEPTCHKPAANLIVQKSLEAPLSHGGKRKLIPLREESYHEGCRGGRKGSGRFREGRESAVIDKQNCVIQKIILRAPLSKGLSPFKKGSTERWDYYA